MRKKIIGGKGYSQPNKGQVRRVEILIFHDVGNSVLTMRNHGSYLKKLKNTMHLPNENYNHIGKESQLDNEK
jgi:hypothetical protein